MRELDEIENAHRSVGGGGRGRRYATHQINHAYAMLLSSQFQGFCRDLHSECVDHIVRVVNPTGLQTVLRAEFTLHRKLDRGNPSPGNIGADFARHGTNFWDEVQTHNRRNPLRMKHLEDLNNWRNAIAHQDFDPSKLGRIIVLRIRRIRTWRVACERLAISFDEILRQHIRRLIGTSPW